jgi:hypothetical protein
MVPVGDIVYANEESSGSLSCQLYGDEELRSRSMIDEILVIHCTFPRWSNWSSSQIVKLALIPNIQIGPHSQELTPPPVAVIQPGVP